MGSQRGLLSRQQGLFSTSFRIVMLESGLAKQTDAGKTHRAPQKTCKHEPWLQPFSTVLFLSLALRGLKGQNATPRRAPWSPRLVVVIILISTHHSLSHKLIPSCPAAAAEPHIRFTFGRPISTKCLPPSSSLPWPALPPPSLLLRSRVMASHMATGLFVPTGLVSAPLIPRHTMLRLGC